MNTFTSLLKQGTGYRCSYNGITATIFGTSSMVARALIARLGKTGTQLVLTYRGSGYDESKYRICGDLGQIYFSKMHLKDEQSIYEALRYSNVVINFIGKGTETRNFSFNEVHVEGARRLARIAKEAGVTKFIHMSALNASPNPTPMILKTGSEFYKSKYYGELAVREEFPEAIIFRPSYILGEKDRFMNHFTDLQRSLYCRKFYIWDYYHGVEKQPIYQRDVVSAIEIAITDDSLDGKTIQAVGPYRYNFPELIEYMRTCAGQSEKYDANVTKNLRWNLPYRALISVVEKIMKYPPLSWERMEQDSTTDIVDPNLPTIADIGVQLTPIEPQIKYLGFYKPREDRVEIPYESATPIEQPRRLNVQDGLDQDVMYN